MFEKKYKAMNSRRHKRLRADYLIKYEIVGAKQPEEISNIKDISASGVRFTSNNPLDKGTLLRVSVLVPPIGATIESVARVHRSRAVPGAEIFYVSAGFIELRAEHKDAINSFVEGLSESSAGKKIVNHPEVVTRTIRNS